MKLRLNQEYMDRIHGIKRTGDKSYVQEEAT